MGGRQDPDIHAAGNLLTLCRDCHRKIHQGPWELEHSEEGIGVLDRHIGAQVMRRLYGTELDVLGLFE